MPNDLFYPDLGSLLSGDDFPEVLAFLKPAMQDILNDIYYDKYHKGSNADGSHFECRLEMLLKKGLNLDLFGSGFRLAVNPDESGNMAVIPVSLQYSHPIFGVMKEFSSGSFPYSPDSMFGILEKFMSLTDKTYAATVVSLLERGDDISAVNVFVDKINAAYDLQGTDAIAYPDEAEYDVMIDETVNAITSNDVI